MKISYQYYNIRQGFVGHLVSVALEPASGYQPVCDCEQIRGWHMSDGMQALVGQWVLKDFANLCIWKQISFKQTLNFCEMQRLQS